MALSQTTAPAKEPITLAEAKIHLGITAADENDYITARIRAARRFCETATGRQFIDASWTWKLPWFPPASVFAVPKPPLDSATSINYIDVAGDSQLLSTDVYETDTLSEPGRIALKYNQSWPGTRSVINAVTVIFKAGYGADTTDVPDTLLEAMYLLIGHRYEHREAVTELRGVVEVPMAVKMLLHSERMLEVG